MCHFSPSYFCCCVFFFCFLRSCLIAFCQLDSKEKGGKVTIEMVSNWGHPSRLGLTEIQLLNELEHLLPVSSSGVFVHGAETMSGSPSILFNGKTKVFCVEI